MLDRCNNTTFINQFQLDCCDKIKQQQSQFQQRVTFVVDLNHKIIANSSGTKNNSKYLEIIIHLLKQARSNFYRCQLAK